MESADGSVAEQIHPAFRRAGIGSQPVARPAFRIGFGCHATETEKPGDPDAGVQDRIVYHHDRDGRSGDDVRFAFGIRLGQVEAGIACGQGLDFRFRNADQDNGLGMADQPGTRQAGIGTDGGKHMDGLARIADRADEIGCEERPGEDPAAAQHRRDRQILADGAIGIGPWDQLAGLDLRQIAGKPGSVEAGGLGGGGAGGKTDAGCQRGSAPGGTAQDVGHHGHRSSICGRLSGATPIETVGGPGRRALTMVKRTLR